MDAQDYKRILIISHNCLSKTGSNGRTLRNYLLGWPKDKIAQLYIHPETPDFEICKNYFCISDSDIMRAIIKRTDAGNAVNAALQNVNSSDSDQKTKRKKNSLLFLLRELAWNSKIWNSSKLWEWLNKYQPEAILFQAGDAGFLFRLVFEISKKYNIPVILYNTEGYYFKRKSYLDENAVSAIFYPCLHHYFCRQYRKLLKRTQVSIYNCEMLSNDYQAAFLHNSRVIMNSSEFTDYELPSEQQYNHHIVYAGNVGVGRHKSIIALAEEVHDIDKEMYVDVYANVKDERIREELEQCHGIRLHGFVPYAELQQIILHAEYLLHVENFSPFYCEDLKYAFSTKIADSLATGNCLIVYAPKKLAVSQYLLNKEASLLIFEQETIRESLMSVLSDETLRNSYGKNGRALALQNHSLNKNRELFQKYISEAICDESTTS